MFCDDANGLVIDMGHHKSYAGFIGEESPAYCCDSQYAYYADSAPYTPRPVEHPIYRKYKHKGKPIRDRIMTMIF